MTPGVRIPDPWSLGFISWEGLVTAAEQALRLTAILALLAILLNGLRQEKLVAAIHTLLRFALPDLHARRIAVRMLLTLELVAAKQGTWRNTRALVQTERPPTKLWLQIPLFQLRDLILLGATVLTTLSVWIAV